MNHFHIMTRRGFLNRSFKIGAAAALASLVDIPLVVKRALAEGNIGINGKKLLFVFLRGANDSLNSIIPIQDSAYNTTNRPTLAITKDGSVDYSTAPGTMDILNTASSSDLNAANFKTFFYNNAIRAGNGFAAVHPSLKFLAPGFNAGHLALVHRVGYPKQSRSHFDSQNYWENGNPNNNVLKEGIFYRAMIESGLANTNPLTGVSIQSSLPLLFRGSAAAMTNLTDPTRYNLIGIPNSPAGNSKSDKAIQAAGSYPFPDKKNRAFLDQQYKNMNDTLSIFSGINFDNTTGNVFTDDVNTDGDTAPYYLFPTNQAQNGGYSLHTADTDNNKDRTQKYVVDNSSSAYSFFVNLKAAALVLNKTDAIIAGTEMGGFDTHSGQGTLTGSHPNLQRRIAWAMYALRKYFLKYGKGGTDPSATTAKCGWNDVVVVTLSEFGRTSKENGTQGTDHAEAGAMFVAGGAVSGGIYGCHNTIGSVPWVTGQSGSMFGVSSSYLKRAIDYRSVLGEVIRDHLGATDAQVGRIIPGYANESAEHLKTGGTSTLDSTPIVGELGIV